MSRRAGAMMYAGGQPLAPQVAEQASRWYVLFLSGAQTEDDERAWRDWRAADPDHERAWSHLARADARMRDLPAKAAYDALSAAGHQRGRRTVLRAAALFAACIGPALWVADRNRWLHISPDHATGVGERRDVVLEDGTRVTLDTDTRIDVRFSSRERILRLRQGQVLVATGHRDGDASTRPFRVDTAHGSIRALGTRFAVRLQDDAAHVALFEGAVEIQPAQQQGAGLVLTAGQTARCMRLRAEPAGPVGAGDTAWLRGELAADNMPLAQFLGELSRYRPGVISCDEQIGRLRVSGLFPLADTDRVLDAVGRLLNLKISRFTPYWVVVSARA
ncbi:FecR domain-containing protein [Achromobacter spanius]|uniref:Iron dicitrate transport regulator FecR n=1 Tax=Achromobacter spanius TaxID=217203 RepID=A0A2S0IEE2_9BURK|nr:FecR family protein [Achromobacter spanius]AVJ30410.1 iron dicitrate transport regulator FecR [Achromobacter spanius]